MQKLTLLFITLATLAVFASAQKPSPIGIVDQSNLDIDNPFINSLADCTLKFRKSALSIFSQFTEKTKVKSPNAYRPTLNGNQTFTRIDFDGTCNCWIVLFNGPNYTGSNIGLWTGDGDNDNSETIHLNEYITFNQNTTANTTGNWLQWDRSAGSYSINCYYV